MTSAEMERALKGLIITTFVQTLVILALVSVIVAR